MLSNKEIVDSHLPLIKRCCDYQFSQCKSAFDKQNKEDFHQDLIVILYEYDNEKLNDALSKGEGTLNALITRIIQNQLYSKSSDYYRRYKRFSERSDELTTITDDEDKDD